MSNDAKQELRLVLDIPPDEYAAVETTVEQVSREHGFDEDEVYEACYLIASGGFGTYDIDDCIWEIADFAEQYQTAIETVAHGAATMMNVFDIEPTEVSDELKRVGETITEHPVTAADVFGVIEVDGPIARHACRDDPLGCVLVAAGVEARRGAAGRELRRRVHESLRSRVSERDHDE